MRGCYIRYPETFWQYLLANPPCTWRLKELILPSILILGEIIRIIPRYNLYNLMKALNVL